MAKDLVLDVIARKNSKELSLLADEFEKLSKQVDDSGKSMQKTTTFSKFLEDQIAKTKGQVRQLGQEFERTGNKDVFAALKGAEKNLKSLESLSKQVAKAVDTGFEEGSQKGIQFLGNAFGSLPPQAQVAVGAGIAGAIVLSSTAIGAAINGVLLAGVGLGGVATGVVAQLHDAAVQKAFDELKSTASGVLIDSTRAFAPVLVDAAHMFRDEFTRAEPVLEKAFDKLAPHAEKVFAGLEKFGEKAAPGFLEALDASGPILDELARDLPGLGAAFSTFFHSLSQGAGGARDGLHSLLAIVEGTVEGVGYLLEGLSKGYETLSAFGDFMSGDFAGAGARMAEVLHGGAKGADDLTRGLGGTARAAEAAAAGLQKMNGELSHLLGNQLSADQANAKFKEDLLSLRDNLDANSRSLADNSLAGLHNQDVIRGLIGDAQQARDAQIQMAGGANASKAAVDAANATYDNAIAAIEAMGVKAGLSKRDLDKLAGTYYVNVIEAISAINSSGLAQNVAPHDVNRYGSAGHRAGGGPVKLGQTYVVNEYGVETFTPAQDGYITPAGSGGGTDRFQIDLTLNGEKIRSILVDHGRRSGFRTVDELLPVGAAR
jgi:hypothetical protein